MWKKDRPDSEAPYSSPSLSSPMVKTSSPEQRSLMGPSISIKGEITGTEDLYIEGCVEGSINLKKNVVTIGPNGRVAANVCGRIIHIEGEVTGDCIGTEQIILHKAGQVKGNICAPRVTVEDGARLQGTIDTGTSPEEHADRETRPYSDPQPARRESVVSDEPQPMI